MQRDGRWRWHGSETSPDRVDWIYSPKIWSKARGHSLRCDLMLVSIGHGYCLGRDWVIAARLAGYDVALVILADFFFERCLSHSKMHRLGCVQKSDKAMCQINQNWSIPV
jgi:hypothetical protein